MRAKVRCSAVQDSFRDKWDDAKRAYVEPRQKEKCQESVSLHAVYSSSEQDPNREWAKATPSGSVMLNIDNPGAWGHFKVDQEYFLDFTLAPKPEAT